MRISFFAFVTTIFLFGRVFKYSNNSLFKLNSSPCFVTRQLIASIKRVLLIASPQPSPAREGVFLAIRTLTLFSNTFNVFSKLFLTSRSFILITSIPSPESSLVL